MAFFFTSFFRHPFSFPPRGQLWLVKPSLLDWEQAGGVLELEPDFVALLVNHVSSPEWISNLRVESESQKKRVNFFLSFTWCLESQWEVSATWDTVVLTVLAPKLWLLLAMEVYGTNPPELVSNFPTENLFFCGRFILSSSSGGKIEAIIFRWLPQSLRLWGLLREFFEDECTFLPRFHTVTTEKKSFKKFEV